jgi:hypothetical protein
MARQQNSALIRLGVKWPQVQNLSARPQKGASDLPVAQREVGLESAY